MKKQLTQKEIFCSNEFFEAINEHCDDFTKNINKADFEHSLKIHIIGEYSDYLGGFDSRSSSNFFDNHIIQDTQFIYEYDTQCIGIYEYEGGVAIVRIFQGDEVHIIGSSIANFFHELMPDDIADELSDIISKKFNVKFEHYTIEEGSTYEKIQKNMNYDIVDYCNKYPELTGYFKSKLESRLYQAILDNQETFSNNKITLIGTCRTLSKGYFFGDMLYASGHIDRGYGRLHTLLYELKNFTPDQINEIKRLLGHFNKVVDDNYRSYKGFDFTITISYEIDSNKVVTIKNTTIEEFKEN